MLWFMLLHDMLASFYAGPVSIAELPCRNADSSVLQQAVKDALLCTHVHPEGIEGAFVQAAAVAVLSNTPTPGKSVQLQSLCPACVLFRVQAHSSLMYTSLLVSGTKPLCWGKSVSASLADDWQLWSCSIHATMLRNYIGSIMPQ